MWFYPLPHYLAPTLPPTPSAYVAHTHFYSLDSYVNVTHCSLVGRYQRFGGVFYLHLHGGHYCTT
jgi:hypothetical protein